MKLKQGRIIEIDILRGICILGMVVVHLLMNYYDFYQNHNYPDFLRFFFDWGGIIFVVLSGIAVTLGHHPIKRGLLVFAAGMICTLVTYGLQEFDVPILVIRFGILHCLGVCMIVSPKLLQTPKTVLTALGLCIIWVGYWFESGGVSLVENRYLYPLGLRYIGFSSGDYFPLAPHLGWFILGIVLGRLLYKKRTSLLGKMKGNFFPVNFLRWCGQQSLWIYLLHQPVLYGVFYLLQI